METVLLPGTAFVELALAAGAEVGVEALEELTLEAPLVLPERGAVQLQLSVTEPDESARRQITIYSRPEGLAADGLGGDEAWTRNASGVLARGSAGADAPAAALAAEAWPPAGAEALEVEDLYDRLAEVGFGYGPAFQGLRAAWRRGEELFAEVSLGEEQAGEVARFGAHPALFDAALHAAFFADEAGGARLPFAWSGVRLNASGAPSWRVRLAPAAGGAISVTAIDEAGVPAVSVDSLLARPVDAKQLERSAQHDSLFHLEWVELPSSSPEGARRRLAVLGAGLELEAAALGAECYPDLAALGAAIEGGAPEVVLVAGAPGADTGELAEAAREALHRALALLQAWLSDERFADSQLVLVTKGALAAREGEDPALAEAPLWGLLRSAQSEHPDRFALVDLDEEEASRRALPAALGAGEPQLAVREGALLAPRLARVGTDSSLVPPAGAEAWRLGLEHKGTFENFSLLACPEAREPLAPGQVRVGVRAAGLNFRDVLIALDLYPGEASIGGEGAGVVLEVGPGVADISPGDRVMGLMPGAFGPIAVTDQRMVIRMPEGWSFVEAASVPIAFLTAYYALVDLAQLKPGEAVLVHAAAGGVGMAAVQLARQLGAEVFASASPGKWEALRELGVDDAHVASSRDLEFKEKFLRATEGRGVDVVLDALAR